MARSGVFTYFVRFGARSTYRFDLITLQMPFPTRYAAITGSVEARQVKDAGGTHHPFVVRRPRPRDFLMRGRLYGELGDIVVVP